MENYTRIPDSIRKNKSLTSTEKLILGYLYTYQNKLVGKKVISTGNYYYDTQAILAEELGTYLREIERALFTLKQKGLIFQTKKSLVDGKSQFKNRKAIIMVDDNNPLPTIDVPNSKPKQLSKPNEVLTPEVEYDDLDNAFLNEPTKDELVIIEVKSSKKIINKLLLIDILNKYHDNNDIQTGDFVDIKNDIDNDMFYYEEDLMKIINEKIEYNNIVKSMYK